MDTAHHFDTLMTHRDRAIEDGHAGQPSGRYTFEIDIPGIGYRNCAAEVQWSLTASDRLTIEGVTVMDELDGEQVLDPVHGAAIERALYALLASEALTRRDDVLADFYA